MFVVRPAYKRSQELNVKKKNIQKHATYPDEKSNWLIFVELNAIKRDSPIFFFLKFSIEAPDMNIRVSLSNKQITQQNIRWGRWV